MEERNASSLGNFRGENFSINSRLHHERNPAALLCDPNGDVLWFPSAHPPHPPSPPDFSSRSLGTAFIQGPHPTAPAPIRPTSTPHRPPKTTAPRTLPHPMALLCVWVVAQPDYCLVQLPSTYFMHKQTTRWHWPGSSDIKTTMSSQDHSETP